MSRDHQTSRRVRQRDRSDSRSQRPRRGGVATSESEDDRSRQGAQDFKRRKGASSSTTTTTTSSNGKNGRSSSTRAVALGDDYDRRRTRNTSRARGENKREQSRSRRNYTVTTGHTKTQRKNSSRSRSRSRSRSDSRQSRGRRRGESDSRNRRQGHRRSGERRRSDSDSRSHRQRTDNKPRIDEGVVQAAAALVGSINSVPLGATGAVGVAGGTATSTSTGILAAQPTPSSSRQKEDLSGVFGLDLSDGEAEALPEAGIKMSRNQGVNTRLATGPHTFLQSSRKQMVLREGIERRREREDNFRPEHGCRGQSTILGPQSTLTAAPTIANALVQGDGEAPPRLSSTGGAEDRSATGNLKRETSTRQADGVRNKIRLNIDTSSIATSSKNLLQEPGQKKDAESFCCLLCRRKFPSAVALKRHEEASELHKQNLAKAAQRH
ncbi:unnamed protein product [Amoebophrya sp. A25]|nr:unnamed protein product [Amoebophrya sp. A25]|eukprot:GSA25T00016033001.1